MLFKMTYETTYKTFILIEKRGSWDLNGIP